MKHFKGGASYKSLGTSDVIENTWNQTQKSSEYQSCLFREIYVLKHGPGTVYFD
jgi:hypothetical protein